MRRPKNLKTYVDSDFPDYVFCKFGNEVRVFVQVGNIGRNNVTSNTTG